jgi:hypothetical protein
MRSHRLRVRRSTIIAGLAEGLVAPITPTSPPTALDVNANASVGRGSLRIVL